MAKCQTGDVVGPHTYHLFMLQTHCVGPLCCLVGWYCGPYAVSMTNLEGMVYLRWRVRGVEQEFIPYMGQLVFANVSVEGWIINIYTHCLLDAPEGG